MKKLIGLLLCLVMVCTLFVGCSEGEPIVWEDIVLGSVLPKPTLEKGALYTNDETALNVYIQNAEKEDYEGYLERCKEMGFTVEAETKEDDYLAYNENGYKLDLDYNSYNKEFQIRLDAPMEMKEIDWPFHDFCDMLPTPEFENGKIEWDNADEFFVYLSGITIEEYGDYAQACKDAGFDIDYEKGETYYRAKNEDGYSLSTTYQGFNIISIKLGLPSEEESSQSESQGEEKTVASQAESKESNEGMDGDFKKAMDEYEEFMDEYVAFMKKYNQSNGTDLSLLSDYAKFTADYAEMLETFEEWDEEELSDEELAYYLEVQTRVTKKLAQIGA